MLFVDGEGRPLFDYEDFVRDPVLGWGEDYVFIQPELDAALRAGVDRFDCVDVRLGSEVTDWRELPARWVVACDGRRQCVSAPRRHRLRGPGLRPALAGGGRDAHPACGAVRHHPPGLRPATARHLRSVGPQPPPLGVPPGRGRVRRADVPSGDGVAPAGPLAAPRRRGTRAGRGLRLPRHRRRDLAQGSAAAGRRRRPPDAAVHGPGHVLGHPRRRQPGLEAARRAARRRPGGPAGQLRGRAPPARGALHRAVHRGGPAARRAGLPRTRQRRRRALVAPCRRSAGSSRAPVAPRRSPSATRPASRPWRSAGGAACWTTSQAPAGTSSATVRPAAADWRRCWTPPPSAIPTAGWRGFSAGGPRC